MQTVPGLLKRLLVVRFLLKLYKATTQRKDLILSVVVVQASKQLMQCLILWVRLFSKT